MRLTEDIVKHMCIVYYGMLVAFTCQCVPYAYTDVRGDLKSGGMKVEHY